MPRGRQTSYPPELRAAVVSAVVDGGASYRQVLFEFGVPRATARSWVQQARATESGDVEPTARARPAAIVEPRRAPTADDEEFPTTIPPKPKGYSPPPPTFRVPQDRRDRAVRMVVEGFATNAQAAAAAGVVEGSVRSWLVKYWADQPPAAKVEWDAGARARRAQRREVHTEAKRQRRTEEQHRREVRASSRQSYSPELKREVQRLIVDDLRSFRQVLFRLNVPRATASGWIDKYFATRPGRREGWVVRYQDERAWERRMRVLETATELPELSEEEAHPSVARKKGWRSAYPPELRRAALWLVVGHRRPVVSVATQLQLPGNTIWQWVDGHFEGRPAERAAWNELANADRAQEARERPRVLRPSERQWTASHWPAVCLIANQYGRKWRSGRLLPTAYQLSKSLDFDSNAVREALEVLERLEILERTGARRRPFRVVGTELPDDVLPGPLLDSIGTVADAFGRSGVAPALSWGIDDELGDAPQGMRDAPDIARIEMALLQEDRVQVHADSLLAMPSGEVPRDVIQQHGLTRFAASLVAGPAVSVRQRYRIRMPSPQERERMDFLAATPVAEGTRTVGETGRPALVMTTILPWNGAFRPIANRALAPGSWVVPGGARSAGRQTPSRDAPRRDRYKR